MSSVSACSFPMFDCAPLRVDFDFNAFPSPLKTFAFVDFPSPSDFPLNALLVVNMLLATLLFPYLPLLMSRLLLPNFDDPSPLPILPPLPDLEESALSSYDESSNYRSPL